MDIATLGLRVDGAGYIRTVEAASNANQRLAVTGGAAEASALRLRSSFGKLIAFVGGGAFLAGVVRNTQEAQYAMASLESGVRSTGGAAGFSAQQLAQMASELQGLTQHEDEAIERGQALLLTFTNIRGDVFKDATLSVLNLAEKMGGIDSASLQIGKALQDPVRGINALRRAGVSFSASQQQVIKDLVNTGRTADAQRMILKELEVEFGGAAAAARNTFGGALRGLKNDFGDLLEVTPQGTGGIVSFINTLDKALLFLKEHLDLVQKTVAFGGGVWLTYTALVKGAAGWSALLALGQKGVAVAVVEETVAVRAATAALVGYETTAVSAGIASTALAAGATNAARSVGLLALAGRGLLSILTGPVGIAIALTTVIALLLRYKSASEQAAEANAQYASSLAGRTDAELKTESDSLRQRMAQQQKMVNDLRAQQRDTLTTGEVESLRAQGNPRLARPAPPPRVGPAPESSEFRRAREELERLQAAYAALGMEERRRANFRPPPMTDMRQVEDNSDKIKARLEQNRAMVTAAQQEVSLAAEQGMAQERLAIQFDAVNKEMEARADIATRSVLPATLAAIRAERALKLEALDVRALKTQQQARENAARTHQQTIALLGAEGAAQTRLRVEYDAANKAIEAQNNLTGRARTDTLADIETERVARLAEEQMRAFVELRRAARDEMRGLFEDIFNNGVSAFGNLFARARELFGKLVADIASRRLMQALGTGFTDQLARIYGGAGKLDPGARQQQMAAAALSGSAASLTGAASALTLAASRLGAPSGVPVGLTHEIASARGQGALQLPGIVATATPKGRDEERAARESASGFAKVFAKYVAPAMAGYFAGNAIGSGTTNRGLGTIGGAASGAAAGYAMGGPVGAIIGGISGAVGGFIGASKRRSQEEAAMREVLQRNGERIKELSENISGLSLFAGKNVANAGKLAAALSGLDGGTIRSKGFAEALKGGETAEFLKRYEKQFGITIADIGRMAKQLGIELFDSAGRAIPGALKQLEEALRLSVKAATQFTNSLDDVQRRQEAYNKLFDVPDTPGRNLSDAYDILGKMAPDLLKQLGLANLNLDTEAARKVLLSGLQDIFKLIDSGMLSPELLGAFKDKDQLIDAILRAKDGLDAFKNTLGTVTTDFPRAMDLLLYEQRYGKGTPQEKTPPSTTPVPPPPPVIVQPKPERPAPPTRTAPEMVTVTFTGDIVLPNYTGGDVRALADEIETAQAMVMARGGFTLTPASGDVTT